MKKINVLIMLMTISVLSACYYDNREDIYIDFPKGCVTTGLVYSTDIEPIVMGYCIGCHSQGGNLPVLETLQQMRDNQITVSESISTGYMPQGRQMSACNVDKILAWYADGAPE